MKYINLLAGMVLLLLIFVGVYIYSAYTPEVVAFEEINRSYDVSYGSLLLEKEIKINENENTETLKLSAEESVEGFVILTVVPKHLAESTAEVDVSTNGKKIVINEDPVFRFENKNLPDAVDVELSIGKGSNEFATINAVFSKQIIDEFSANELEEFYAKFAELGEYKLTVEEVERIEKSLAEKLIHASTISFGETTQEEEVHFADEYNHVPSPYYDPYLDALDEVEDEAAAMDFGNNFEENRVESLVSGIVDIATGSAEPLVQGVEVSVYGWNETEIFNNDNPSAKIVVSTEQELESIDLFLVRANEEGEEERFEFIVMIMEDIYVEEGGWAQEEVNLLEYGIGAGEYYIIVSYEGEAVAISNPLYVEKNEVKNYLKKRELLAKQYYLPPQITLKVGENKRTSTYESYFVIGEASDVRYICNNFDCPMPATNNVLVDGTRYSKNNELGLEIEFIDEDDDGSELEGVPYKIKVSVDFSDKSLPSTRIKKEIRIQYPVTAGPVAKFDLIIEKVGEEKGGVIFYNSNLLEMGPAWGAAINSYSSKKGWKAIAFNPPTLSTLRAKTVHRIFYEDGSGGIKVVLDEIDWQTESPSLEIEIEEISEEGKKTCKKKQIELSSTKQHSFCDGEFILEYYDYEVYESGGNNEAVLFKLRLGYEDPSTSGHKMESFNFVHSPQTERAAEEVEIAKEFKKAISGEYQRNKFDYMIILDLDPTSAAYIGEELTGNIIPFIPAVTSFEAFKERVDPNLEEFTSVLGTNWFDEFILNIYYGDVDGDYLQDIAIGRLNFAFAREFEMWQKMQKGKTGKKYNCVFEEDPLLAASRVHVLERYKKSFLFSGLEYETIEPNQETAVTEKHIPVYLNAAPEKINKILEESDVFEINAHGNPEAIACSPNNAWVKLSRSFGKNFFTDIPYTIMGAAGGLLGFELSGQYAGASVYHTQSVPKLVNKQPIIFASSCSTAQNIGHVFLKNGARLYIGNEGVKAPTKRIFPVSVSENDISYGELVVLHNRYSLKIYLNSKSAAGFGMAPISIIGDPSTKVVELDASQENSIKVTLGNSRVTIDAAGDKYVNENYTLGLHAVGDFVILEVTPGVFLREYLSSNFIVLADLDAGKFREILASEEFSSGEVWNYVEKDSGLEVSFKTEVEDIKDSGIEGFSGFYIPVTTDIKKIVIGGVSGLEAETA